MQNEEKTTVCRLCGKSDDPIFEIMETVPLDMLKIFELNVDVNENSVICKNCSENVQNSFTFRSALLQTENCINFFKTDNSTNLDMREIYLSKNKNESNLAIPKDTTVCRLCMEVTEPECYIILNEAKDVPSARTILEKYFPELDLDIIKNPAVCIPCHSSLCSHFSFVKTCLSRADTVKKYREDEGTCMENETVSDFGVQCATQKLSSYENGITDTNISKYCNESNEVYDKSKLKHENLVKVETQEIYIKQEIDEHDEVKVLRSTPTKNTFYSESDYASADIKKYEGELNDEIELKSEACVETESHERNLKHEEAQIETKDSDIARFQDSTFSYRSEVKQELTSNDSSVEKMYKCEICSYATNHKYAINRHTLTHKDASEIPMYQCEICKFETKYKNSIEKHLILHKTRSEKYQCEKCNYQTKIKRYWHLHMLFHKKTDLTVYSCDFCTYKTKRKIYLKCHTMIHKDPSEVKTYHCDVCEYKTKYKSSLNRHVLIHRNVPEVKVFPCGLCSYTAKHKSSVKRHMLIHKNISEITMYQCDICAFKTRRKSVLHRHMLVHRDASEITVFSCELCTYKTKQKDNLKRHSLVHKDASEVTLHRCDICDFRTKHKQSLKTHMQVHKNASEVETQ